MTQGTILLIILFSVLLIVIFSIVRIFRKGRTRCEVLNIGFENDLDKMLKIRKELDFLHDDIVMTINSGITRLDSRIVELKELLIISDEKILFLNSLMGEAEGRLQNLEEKLRRLEKNASLNDKERLQKKMIDKQRKRFGINQAMIYETELSQTSHRTAGMKKLL